MSGEDTLKQLEIQLAVAIETENGVPASAKYKLSPQKQASVQPLPIFLRNAWMVRTCAAASASSAAARP